MRNDPAASVGAIPHLARGLHRRLNDRRLARRLRRTVETICVPPPPERWAAFGESLVVTPARVDNPHLIAIGDRVLIHENCWFSVVRPFHDVDTRLTIEDDVRIGRSCQLSIAGRTTIKRGAIIGDFVQIGDTFHPFEVELRMPSLTRPRDVLIGRGAVLLSHVIVVPGVTIGPGAQIEHHSVVTQNVPAGAVFAGVPAQPVTANAPG